MPTGCCNQHKPYECQIRITIAVAARGANMATRYYNDSTVDNSASTCLAQVSGPDCPQEHSANINRGTGNHHASRAATKSSRKKQLMLAAALGLMIAPAVGCTMASGLGSNLRNNDKIDEFMIGYRNQAWSAKAWHCRKQRFCNHRFVSDFETGFKAGYQSIAEGGNGCTPSLCPQSYWGWQYQAADGQARMNAWFEAFPLGVQAAEEDGIGHWGQVQGSMPAPAPVRSAGSFAPAAAAGGATAALSDQKEQVPTPVPDPKASQPKATPPKAAATRDTATPKADKPATKKSAVEAMPDKPLFPKADELNAMPEGRLQPLTPKAPVIPQPNNDPFGFD